MRIGAYVLPPLSVEAANDDIRLAIFGADAKKFGVDSFHVDDDRNFATITLVVGAYPGYPDALKGVNRCIGDIVVEVDPGRSERVYFAAVTEADLVSKEIFCCADGDDGDVGKTVRTVYKIRGPRLVEWQEPFAVSGCRAPEGK